MGLGSWSCAQGSPGGLSCPLGWSLTRIAGTRVMVGVDTSFVAAPDGGPGFLAAGTCLVRTEGRQVSLPLRGQVGASQGPCLFPMKWSLKVSWNEAWNRVHMPTGLILGCSLGGGTSLTTYKHMGHGFTQTWVQSWISIV